MAARFWIGGTANWDASTTTNWSATSGGSGGASVPTSSDDVTFDTLSNATAYTVTVTATANCLSLTIGNPATGVTTFAGSSSVNVAGNLSTASGVLWTAAGILTFTATSGTKTITTNSVVINGISSTGTIVFNGSGGTFQLVDDLTTNSNLSFTAGTFDATTNSRKVTITGNSPVQAITGTPTFYDLRVIPTTPSKDNIFNISGNITVTNTFTTSSGATATNRVYIKSNALGTARTITAASISIANADFRDITGAGAASWDMSAASGGSGDCGGNSMKSLGSAAFTAATTQHWTNVNGGSWSNSANWTSRVPLPQDSIVMDAAFGTSKTVTMDMPRLGNSIDWTGATWTTDLTWSTAIPESIFGSMTLISGLTLSLAANLFTFEGRASYTLDLKTVTIETNITLNAPGGTLSLAGNSTLGVTRTLTITRGTFSTSNYVLSSGLISVGSSGTLTLGTETDLITGTGTVFTGTGTINPGTSTLKFTDTSNSAISISGSKTYNNFWFSRGASTGSVAFFSSNTFADIKDTGTAAHSILFASGTTTTVTTFTVTGNGSGNEITINTASGTATHALIKSGVGTISSDYLNIQHSVATPASTWYAGTHSVNNQATSTAGSGWTFTAVPTGPTYLGFGMFFG